MGKKNGYDVIFLIFLLGFASLKIYSLTFHSEAWWDSAVYIGMGRYIYSLGNSGLFEASRPLALPLILGAYCSWAPGCLIYSKLLAMTFSVACVAILYFIISDIFGKKSAILALVLLAFNPTFFFFNIIPGTEIPSTFFLLMGLFLMLRRHYSWAGLLLGLSFSTRFFQIFAILPILIGLGVMAYRKEISLKQFGSLLAYFSIPVFPYLVFNAYAYGNPVYPFALQSFMTAFTGWEFREPYYYYIVGIVRENFLVVFVLPGIYAALRRREIKNWIFVLSFVLPFLLYSAAQRKEMRIIIPILPFLCGLVAVGLESSFSWVRKRAANRKLLAFLIIALSCIWLLQIAPQLRIDKNYGSMDEFRDYLNSKKSSDGIWISNPSFILDTDKKADELIYYPLYNSTKAVYLEENLGRAKSVLINTCDLLPCPPWDNDCEEKTLELLGALKRRFNTVHYNRSKECEHYIFESKK